MVMEVGIFKILKKILSMDQKRVSADFAGWRVGFGNFKSDEATLEKLPIIFFAPNVNHSITSIHTFPLCVSGI